MYPIWNSKLNCIFSQIIPEIKYCVCKLHNSKSCAKNFDLSEIKQARIINKLITVQKKKRNILASTDAIPGANIDFSENSRRINRRKYVLEALFMDHIAGLFANEEIDGIKEYPLEITNVKVSSNYNNINVWWNSNDFKTLKEVAKILDENSGKIRSMLIARNIMGRIPQIKFVLDKQSNKLTELEYALSKADFGPDYEHDAITNLTTFKSPITTQSLESVVNQNFQALKGQECVKSKEWTEDPYIAPLDMKQNILGLEHSQMMEQVKLKKHRRSIATRKLESDENITDITVNTSYENNATNRAIEFQQFIKQRKIVQKKESKKTKIKNELQSVMIEEMYEKNYISDCDNEDEHEDYYDESE